MTMRMVLGLALAIAAGPAAAQTAAPVTMEAPDPARLVAAREVIDLALPPATRQTMFAQMTTAMSANMRQGIVADPQFKAIFAEDPRVLPIFDRYLAKIQSRTADYVRTNMPALFDAMGRAYARRFTLVQLADLKAFFLTATGRYYMAQTGTIMSDPDVAAAQTSLMIGAMSGSQTDVKAMVAEISALPPLKPGV